jgi:hypothetical protein
MKPVSSPPNGVCARADATHRPTTSATTLLAPTRHSACRAFHDGAQHRVASCERTSAVLGMTETVMREHVDDRRVSRAAAPGVSILPGVLGGTVVRRHRVPCGTRDQPIYPWASRGSQDATRSDPWPDSVLSAPCR